MLTVELEFGGGQVGSKNGELHVGWGGQRLLGAGRKVPVVGEVVRMWQRGRLGTELIGRTRLAGRTDPG